MNTATTTPPQDDCLTHVGIDDTKYPASTNNSLELPPTEKRTEIIEMILSLQTNLVEANSEREMLKIKLDESNRTAESLRRELDECKLTMFHSNEDCKKVNEEIQRNKLLEEDYVRLMSNFLNLSERYEQERQNIHDVFMAKTNAINNYESLMSRDALKDELDQCKAELNLKLADANLLSAKLRNMEEDNSIKEKCITELRKSLDDARVTHKHEITVLEEYIQCLKNTITSYEKTLATYIDDNNDIDTRSLGGVDSFVT